MTVSQPLFSIIVPTYNEEKLLPKLLASIQSQTFKDYEVILADDSSADDTPSIARQFGARLLSNNGIGEYPSRNAGAWIAEGSILVFTGADVLMPPNLLSLTAAKFARDPTLAGVYCPTYPYDAAVWAKVEFVLFHVLNTLVFLLTREANASTAFLAIRSDIFRRTGGFQNIAFADSTFTRRYSRILKIRPCLDMVIFVSGRRTRMGASGFNRYHLGLLVNVLFRFLRKSQWLQNENEYRISVHTKSKKPKN